MEGVPGPETGGGEINNILLNPESIPQEISAEASQVIVKLIRSGGEGTLMGEADRGVCRTKRIARIRKSLHGTKWFLPTNPNGTFARAMSAIACNAEAGANGVFNF